MKQHAFLVLGVLLTALSNAAQAQVAYLGNTVFNGATSSASLTPPPLFSLGSPGVPGSSGSPGGATLTGDFYVTVPAGVSSGFMLEWSMQRTIDHTVAPTYPFLVTTLYDGFISIDHTPITNVSGGSMKSAIYRSNGTMVPGTLAQLPTFFQNATPGSQTNFFLAASSPAVTLAVYTPLLGDYLRLDYGIDLNYNGPGGMFTLNFPAAAMTSAVPEPTSMLALAGLCTLIVCRRR